MTVKRFQAKMPLLTYIYNPEKLICYKSRGKAKSSTSLDDEETPSLDNPKNITGLGTMKRRAEGKVINLVRKLIASREMSGQPELHANVVQHLHARKLSSARSGRFGNR